MQQPLTRHHQACQVGSMTTDLSNRLPGLNCTATRSTCGGSSDCRWSISASSGTGYDGGLQCASHAFHVRPCSTRASGGCRSPARLSRSLYTVWVPGRNWLRRITHRPTDGGSNLPPPPPSALPPPAPPPP